MPFELMLMHDSMVDRTTDGTGASSSFTAAQLRLLAAGAWRAAAYSGARAPPPTWTRSASSMTGVQLAHE